jgi:hypothetical protein
MNQEQRERLDEQEESQLRTGSAQTAQRIAAEQKERTIHNEDFLNELRKLDLDSDTFGWVKEEYPEMFSGIHAVSNRGDHWAKEADLRMANKRERAIAEGRPGRLLRTRPFLRASMEGKESPQLDAYDRPGIPGDREYWNRILFPKRGKQKETTMDPITSEEARVINGAADAAADLMALSRNAAGLDAVSTVKTDSTVRKESKDESTKERLGRIMG